MTIAGIREAVNSILTTSNKFVTVLDQPPEKTTDFAGYPSATHYYKGTQANYATVSQNRRVVEYGVELYLVTNHSSVSVQLGEIYVLADEIIDLFDKSINLDDSCDHMRPAFGRLDRISHKESKGFMLEIVLFCEADIAFRT